MRRNTQRDAIEVGQRQIGEAAIGALGQHQRERSRPIGFGQTLRGRVKSRQRACACKVGDMRDQRIKCRASFGCVEPRHRFAVTGVGAESIDGLGRERDQSTGRKAANRRGGGAGAGFHRLSSRLSGHFGIRWTANLQLAGARGYKPPLSRSVAQSGSAPRSGRGGRRFKSCHSDQARPLGISRF